MAFNFTGLSEVLNGVALETHNPRSMSLLASHLDSIILADRLESSLEGISRLHIFLSLFDIPLSFKTFWCLFGRVKMQGAAVVKNTGIKMNPSFELGSLSSVGHGIYFAIFFRDKFIDISIAFLIESVSTLWHESR